MRKILTLVIIAAFIVVDISLVRASYQSSQKLAQINKQEDRVKLLEQKNKGLQAELTKKDLPFNIETEARNRLNYGRVGETAIVVQNQALSDAEKATKEAPKSNFQKWLSLITN